MEIFVWCVSFSCSRMLKFILFMLALPTSLLTVQENFPRVYEEDTE